jgi:hypothetical protein
LKPLFLIGSESVANPYNPNPSPHPLPPTFYSG